MDRKKYIVEASDDVKKVMAIGVTHGGAIWTDTTDIEQEIRAQIEKNKGLKLAVGEINNHLSILEGLLRNERDDVQKQVNEAYQRGLEDGKAQSEGGCEGCRFEGTICTACENCCNSHMNHWTAKDDKIEVGDEVNWLGDCFIVTRIFQPRNMKEQCDGIDDDGCVYHDVLIKDLEKTGRHFDIPKILAEMRT